MSEAGDFLEKTLDEWADKNKRDTQFANFADALYMECTTIYQEASIRGCIDADQRVIRNIASRAYDLVGHTLGCVAKAMGADSEVRFVPKNDASLIPDMTEWPDEGKE